MGAMRQFVRAIVCASVLFFAAYVFIILMASVVNLIDLPALFTISPAAVRQRAILAEDSYPAIHGGDDEQQQHETLPSPTIATPQRESLHTNAVVEMHDHFILDQLLPDPRPKLQKVTTKAPNVKSQSVTRVKTKILPIEVSAEEYPSLRIGRLWIFHETKQDHNSTISTTTTHVGTEHRPTLDARQRNKAVNITPSAAATTTPIGSYSDNGPVIVTALLDIGRGQWFSYRRPYDEYLRYFANLLKLRNRFVIFADRRGADFVRQRRKNVETDTIYQITMRDLPFYRYRDEIEQIMTAEQQQWQSSWDPAMRTHPESRSADYDILVNSKSYFLYNASLIPELQGAVFAWIDAGYGHGETAIFPSREIWRPRLPAGKLTLIKITPLMDPISRYSIANLYRKDWSVVSGGFLAGDEVAINSFYRFYQKIFLELLNQKRIDDDQTVLVLLVKDYPTLFNVVHGGWFDAFRL